MEPAPVVPYTVFKLGPSQLHQLHTAQGRVFISGEVAAALFALSPTAFLQELRVGKYQKIVLQDPDALATVAALVLPVESSAGPAGVAALPPATVQQLLIDRRRLDLLQPFKLALLKLASQEAARLMAAGDYAAALPVALDAVRQGEALFRPGPALQMFPLYLLVAQANLGLRRVQQCSDALRLAGLLALKEPAATTALMLSQLARLNGQLAALQGKTQRALSHFARDVYCCSLEYGPRDVLQEAGDNPAGALACGDAVVSIWRSALAPLVLGPAFAEPAGHGADDGEGEGEGDGAASAAAGGAAAAGAAEAGPGPGAAAGAPVAALARLPVGRLQLLEVADMLADVARSRARARGEGHGSVGEAQTVAALALLYVGDTDRARELLDAADAAVPLTDARGREMLAAAARAADEAAAFAASEAARAGGAGGGGFGSGSLSSGGGGGAWLGRSAVGASR
ncbi:hypothetical protein Rsub_08154 [Raphidocelis subcapitata]|uniref:Uncharacterized protein n=1 Tax=Raphidocelis subcapitata TaxID=307507 RepID=A0A2V0P4V3_9CHLO|nr:hypothetical protein Rsub_08154 [Raphidocelis subcapitata]|eukprot:GBF94911.1 hypothetical protein Rsub_08154 [Raphidocelis subcapitata]